MTKKMHGSISLVSLMLCLLLVVISALALTATSREYTREREFLRGQQLRSLCGAVFLQQADILPEGEHLLYETVLLPENEKVQVSAKKTSSSDGLLNYLEFTAQAANHAGAMQCLRRLQLNFTEQQCLWANSSTLVAVNLTGQEYLPTEAIYTSAKKEEVALPKVNFLSGKAVNSLAAKEAQTNGLSACFYYIPSSTSLQFYGSKTYSGASVVVNKGNITLGAKAKFPDRLALFSEYGEIVINKNCQLDKAFIMSNSAVTIAPGCKINGLIIARTIILQGPSTFTADASVVAPFASVIFPNK